MSDATIGRQSELKTLNALFKSQQAEFLVLYGRRRIGKTFLIENFFREKSCYFLHVTGIQHAKQHEQLKIFMASVAETFYAGLSIATPTSWLDAFATLDKVRLASQDKKKIILFFDEFPWLCTKKSGLIQALDYYWNRHWKNDKRIKLIVCGSSAAWIIRKILHHKGGLHNRNTCSILLKPLDLQETHAYLVAQGNKLNHQQLILLYAAMGGVPYYLNAVPKHKSANQVIEQLCFKQASLLYEEFDKLFQSLFDDASIYIEILRSIAKSRSGLSRSALEKSSPKVSKGGTLTDRLKDLEDAAFIQKFMPFTHSRQGIYYRIADEYCYFYLTWIEPAKQNMSLHDKQHRYWHSLSKTPAYYHWLGYAFENLCYKNLHRIREALDIQGGVRIGAWRYVPRENAVERGAQIDLILDRDDDIVTLCEIKHTNKAFVIDREEALGLRRKMEVYKARTKTKKQLQWLLISANGLKANRYSDELISHVLTLDDLFSF